MRLSLACSSKLLIRGMIRHQLDCYIFKLMSCGACGCVSEEVQVHHRCYTHQKSHYRISKLPRLCSNALSIDGQFHRPWRPPFTIHTAHVSVWCSLLGQPWRYYWNNHTCLAMRFSWMLLSIFAQSAVDYRQQVTTDMLGPRSDRSPCTGIVTDFFTAILYWKSLWTPKLCIEGPEVGILNITEVPFGSAIRLLRYDNNKFFFFSYLFNRYQSIRPWSWPHFQIIHSICI